ncbi:unnamed protein product [Acanthoscelides obtectus]|uniref:Uncharacterized protein n=1 Tax=Acanthoscelides obtectus TaxID=200917 RepID=A0A9P0K809_ACAOB|nr:unnamed protein product [Acanthoscelides obtectus]CAK1656990.1 hypothetical protein AOBTE_LOCUS20064 [Acanthoscelides obtectus]
MLDTDVGFLVDCAMVISQDALEIIEHLTKDFKISGNLSHANRTTKVLNLSFWSRIEMENLTLVMKASLWMGNRFVPFKSIKYSVMVTQLLELPFYDIPKLVYQHARPPLVPPLKPNVTYSITEWSPTSFPNFPDGRWLVHLEFFKDMNKDVLLATTEWYLTITNTIEWSTTTLPSDE